MFKRFRLKKLYCYFDLTIAGIWIGWYTFIGCTIFMLLDAFAIFLLYWKGCEEFQNYLLNYDVQMTDSDFKICDIGIACEIKH